MPWWQWLVDTAGVVLLALLAFGIALWVRRRVLARHGGTFELSYRIATEHEGHGWALGLGRYSGERLEWFRLFSVSPKPRVVWPRVDLSYDGHREPQSTERTSLYPDHVVIHCQSRGSEVELAMSPGSLTGFQSWLEAKPPGTDWTTRN